MKPAIVRDDVADCGLGFEASPPKPPRTVSIAALNET